MENEEAPPFEPELMSKERLVALAYRSEEAERARIAHHIDFITKFSELVQDFSKRHIAVTLRTGEVVEPEGMSKEEAVALARRWQEAERARVAHDLALIGGLSELLHEFAKRCTAIALQRGGVVEAGEN